MRTLGLALSVTAILWTMTAAAQVPAEPGPSSVVPVPIVATQPSPIAPVRRKSHEFLIAPIPSQNPSQGWGLALVTAVIFHGKDSPKPSSIIGAGGFYTQEESYGFGAAYLGFHRADAWRTTIGALYGRVHYDYFGTGNDSALLDDGVPIRQEFTGGLVQVMRRVRPHLYLGVRVIGGDSSVGVAPDTIPVKDIDFSLLGAGLALEHDTRDDMFYPEHGVLFHFHADTYEGDSVVDFTHQGYQADFNHYKALGKKNVLASRGYVQYVTDDAPVFELCLFGAHNDLRGYVAGKYRDQFMIAVQSELRRELKWRFGGVVFAGLGEVAPGLDDLNTDDLLWSAGAGIRFRLTKDNKINFRLDWAYGTDGSAYYLAVGEAF